MWIVRYRRHLKKSGFSGTVVRDKSLKGCDIVIFVRYMDTQV